MVEALLRFMCVFNSTCVIWNDNLPFRVETILLLATIHAEGSTLQLDTMLLIKGPYCLWNSCSKFTFFLMKAIIHKISDLPEISLGLIPDINWLTAFCAEGQCCAELISRAEWHLRQSAKVIRHNNNKSYIFRTESWKWRYRFLVWAQVEGCPYPKCRSEIVSHRCFTERTVTLHLSTGEEQQPSNHAHVSV